MCTRGVYQLRRLTLHYCDWGGSSKGVREFLGSETFTNFKEKNPQIELNVVKQKGAHPFLTSLYLNGFVKDTPLRNLNDDEILEYFLRARNSVGRKSLKHSGKKVYGIRESIQGKWTPNLWNNYPKHELEVLPEIPEANLEMEEVENTKLLNKNKVNVRDRVNELMKDREKYHY